MRTKASNDRCRPLPDAQRWPPLGCEVVLLLLCVSLLPACTILYELNELPRTEDIALADLDGDGTVDVVSGSSRAGITVWLNDGNARFRRQ